MGLMILAIVLSMVLGCVIWLMVGSKFPPNEPDENKLPPLNNIVIYCLLSLLPVYLLIFFIFS